MAITLGRSGSLSSPVGAGIISVSKTQEAEVIDTSNRTNASGGYRVYEAGFTNETWEVECHDATGVMAGLEANPNSGLTVYSVSENIPLDGAVTFTITLKSNGPA